MFYFITWVIEYSDDDRLARLLFIAGIPLLLVAKLVLSIGDGIRALRTRRDRVVAMVSSSDMNERVAY